MLTTGPMMLTVLQRPSSVEVLKPHRAHWCSLCPLNPRQGTREWWPAREKSCSRRVSVLQMEVAEVLRAVDLDEVHLLAVAVSANQDNCSASDLAYCRICTCLSGF